MVMNFIYSISSFFAINVKIITMIRTIYNVITFWKNTRNYRAKIVIFGIRIYPIRTTLSRCNFIACFESVSPRNSLVSFIFFCTIYKKKFLD